MRHHLLRFTWPIAALAIVACASTSPPSLPPTSDRDLVRSAWIAIYRDGDWRYPAADEVDQRTCHLGVPPAHQRTPADTAYMFECSYLLSTFVPGTTVTQALDLVSPHATSIRWTTPGVPGIGPSVSYGVAPRTERAAILALYAHPETESASPNYIVVIAQRAAQAL